MINDPSRLSRKRPRLNSNKKPIQLYQNWKVLKLYSETAKQITQVIAILIFNLFYLGRYRVRKFRTGAPKGQYFSFFSSKLDVSQLPQKINFSPKKKIMNRWARKKNNGGDTALLLSSY